MKVGAIQLRSTLDPEANLEVIRHYLTLAKKKDLQYIFLPECFYSLSDGQRPTPFLVEHGNIHYKNIQKLATDFQIHLLGGSAATLINGKIYNRSYNFSPQGVELPSYDKIHLFSCNVPDADNSLKEGQGQERKVVDEGRIYASGTKGQILDLGNFKLGLAICFDLRFPEMFRDYFREGANVLSISSAFTVPTGKAHWHALLQARAIENQSYVIASAQWGKNHEKVSTFGHSLIIDPWGKILSDAGEGEGMISATLDYDYLKEVRARMKVF